MSSVNVDVPEAVPSDQVKPVLVTLPPVAVQRIVPVPEPSEALEQLAENGALRPSRRPPVTVTDEFPVLPVEQASRARKEMLVGAGVLRLSRGRKSTLPVAWHATVPTASNRVGSRAD